MPPKPPPRMTMRRICRRVRCSAVITRHHQAEARMTALRFVLSVAAVVFMIAVPATFVTRAPADDVTTLPNGWRISPAGTTAALGSLPLHLVEDPSGRWLAAVNGGYGELAVSIIEEASGRVVSTAPLQQAFYGIAFSHDGRSLYVATADGDAVRRYSFDPSRGALTLASDIPLGHGKLWIAGLAVAGD